MNSENTDRIIVVYDWFISDLELKGNELLVFSLIYSFSKDEQGCFYGSLQYIADRIGTDKSLVCKIMSKLVEKNYITKETRKLENGGFGCIYCANMGYILSQKNKPSCQNDHTELSKRQRASCQNDHERVVKMTTNNKGDNKDYKKDDNKVLTQSADCEEKEKKEKPKTQNRVVTDRYCAIYEEIFHKKFVPPRENYWIIIANRLKQVFKYYSLEDILTALDMAKNDSFILEKKYDLSMILSDGMMLRLSNPEYNKTNKTTVSDKRKAGENFVDEDGIPF